MPRRLILALSLTLVLPACAVSRQSSLDALNARAPQAYRGHYATADGSWFRPCGAAAADAAWWVTITGRAVAQLDSARTRGLLRANGTTYVEWRAVYTTGGEVGPRGRGAPALLVRDIQVVRPASSNDCAGP